jgi:hypothetical protein
MRQRRNTWNTQSDRLRQRRKAALTSRVDAQRRHDRPRKIIWKSRLFCVVNLTGEL